MNDKRNSSTSPDGLEREKLELDRSKFEFEKTKQEQQYALELGRQKQARVDSWLRTASGVFIGGIISAAIAGYGIYSENERTKRAEQLRLDENKRALRNAKSDTFIKLVSTRESANTNLRARMFEALLSHYFKAEDYKSKIAMLELIGLNFRDAIQIKPVFEHLVRELGEDSPDGVLLQKAIKSIIADQLDEIREARDGLVCEETLTLDAEPLRPSCFSLLTIALTGVDEDAIKVSTNSRDGFFLAKDEQSNRDEFGVSFYDMPMTDYTSVFYEDLQYKYSIVLKEIVDERQARVVIAVLPVESFSSHQRYKFDELLADYEYFLH